MNALARLWLAGALLTLSGICTRLARRMLPVPPEIDPLACDKPAL